MVSSSPGRVRSARRMTTSFVRALPSMSMRSMRPVSSGSGEGGASGAEAARDSSVVGASGGGSWARASEGISAVFSASTSHAGG